jgi:hypothetical protein
MWRGQHPDPPEQPARARIDTLVCAYRRAEKRT